jgi:hypothetical protein
VFFEALKHVKATITGEFHDDSVNDPITKIIQAYEQTTTSSTIRGSVHRAGMGRNVISRPFKIHVDEKAMRAIPGFQTVWE